MQILRFINRITPPVLWDIGKRLVRPEADEVVPPFVDAVVGSFSQYGEDLVIDALLGCPADGVYVDVGANDPSELSNTRRFYDRGWRGINIEPNAELFSEFKRSRPGDVNLNIGIAQSAGELTFYQMEPSTLSTFDRGASIDNLAHPGAHTVAEVRVPVRPLTAVLDEHLADKLIDFMSVDTEGLDLEVLQSNDWHRFRPKLVIVEIAWRGTLIAEYLSAQRYSFIWSNGVNGVFADADQPIPGVRAASTSS